MDAASDSFQSRGSAIAQERIRISSDWGEIAAELADNEAARALTRLLPLIIDMNDHLRQEKTGHLPSPLPDLKRQRDFTVGMAVRKARSFRAAASVRAEVN
ncbi:cyclophilin-like fold protein [Shinella sp.]|uniref:cyclophilin-like fold protein n=1 Tax=Shinella sp. TaxID=1870904 RepID=UPI00301B8C06